MPFKTAVERKVLQSDQRSGRTEISFVHRAQSPSVVSGATGDCCNASCDHPPNICDSPVLFQMTYSTVGSALVSGPPRNSSFGHHHPMFPRLLIAKSTRSKFQILYNSIFVQTVFCCRSFLFLSTSVAFISYAISGIVRRRRVIRITESIFIHRTH